MVILLVVVYIVLIQHSFKVLSIPQSIGISMFEYDKNDQYVRKDDQSVPICRVKDDQNVLKDDRNVQRRLLKTT